MKCKVTFLTMCLDNSITPKCLIPMKYRLHNLKPKSNGAVEVLCNEIRSLKIDIEKQLKLVRLYRYNLKYSLDDANAPVQHFNELLDSCYNISRFESNKALSRHNQKFEKIFTQSPWFKFSVKENVVNLSLVLLTRDQICVLGYGISFSLSLDPNCILYFLTNFSKFEYNYNKYNNSDLSALKRYILNTITQELSVSIKKFPKRLMDAINYLRSRKDIIITKADKGGKTVILDKISILKK